jgi:hypothetical protein
MKRYLPASLAIVSLSLAGCAGSGSSSGSGGVVHTSKIGLWTTTSTPNGNGQYTQIDRLARPAINELFATVANNRHEVNDEDSPPNDVNQLKNDIDGFLISPANRSPQIRAVIESVLVPDMLTADVSQSGSAAYLGVETGGATGSKFGGRALTDDVIKTSLGIVFGNTIPGLGLAPDDNNEVPTLTDDHVGPGGKHFLSTFPYLGNPL